MKIPKINFSPTEKEKNLKKFAFEEIKKYFYPLIPQLFGSVAKDTDLRNNYELDIFLNSDLQDNLTISQQIEHRCLIKI